MFKIKIIGAGQLGSRHLQALKAVKQPLDIQVVDPSAASLQVAKERYDAVSTEQAHQISFSTSFDRTDGTDVAIVATNSDVRRKALESLFDASETRLLVVEKLLFNHRADYAEIESKLAETGAKAWVNCPMRVMPVYEQIRENIAATPISYRVTGSQFGLVTNAIHYIDHVAHLCGCTEFELDTSGLDRNPIPSKRPGFLELNGTLVARFADGSRCEITCYPTGAAPVVVEIFNEKNRYVIRESEGKLWHAGERSKWAWLEQAAPIPYQSQITTEVVESLLSTGDCGLTPYETSVRIHLQLLDPMLELVRSQSPETTGYPFT
jgi:predicted dehydrogenase